jgi:hypothetical protein
MYMFPNDKKKGYLLSGMLIQILAKAAEGMYSCSKEYPKGWRDARQNVCKTDTCSNICWYHHYYSSSFC